MNWSEPTVEAITAGAKAVVDGTWRPMFPERVLAIEWVDDDWTATEDHHARLLAFWNEHRQRSDIRRLTVSDVDPSSLKKILPFVLLLDVVDQGYDARYRVYGTGVSGVSGKDWTGYLVSEMNREIRLDVDLFYRSTYLAVYQRGMPIFTHHRSKPLSAPKSWKRLTIPVFGKTGEAVMRFLVCNVPISGGSAQDPASQRLSR